LALRSEDPLVRSRILYLCSDPHNDKMLQFLRQELDITIDRWSYKPTTNNQSLEGYVGLRNLGSTCYMNAIFQQLYFTFYFRYLLLTREFTDESHKALKKLFTELTISRCRFADTQPFCAVWKGWDKRIINPREQQDASEFFQLLLDQLPSEMNSMFKGQFRNTVEGIHETYKSSSLEDFYTIGLNVKGFENVETSLINFLQYEIFQDDNQYSIGDRTIDARKFTRIEKAPETLVLLLKRFEYNLQTSDRQKINKRYEFPPELDLSKYMVEGVIGTFKYELKGIVLHSGTAQGGHYSSLILRLQKWIEFNDMEVSEMLETRFDDAVFGKSTNQIQHLNYNKIDEIPDFDTGTCAYLLFYQRIGAIINIDDEELKYDVEIPFDSKMDQEIINSIEHKNDEHFKLQALFDSGMHDFFIKINDQEVLLKYFF
jgi:ubiquitin C-terminal hydrolase